MHDTVNFTFWFLTNVGVLSNSAKGRIANLSLFAAANGWVLGPTRVTHPNGISIGLAVFAWTTNFTSRQTRGETALLHLYSDRPHLMHWVQAMWPKIYIVIHISYVIVNVEKQNCNYTVSGKRCYYIFAANFAKFWPIFKSFSLTDLPMNL